MLHTRRDQLSHILCDENDAHVLCALDIIERLIDLLGCGGNPASHTRKRKPKHRVSMTDNQNLHATALASYGRTRKEMIKP